MKTFLIALVIAVAAWAVYSYVMAPGNGTVHVLLTEQNASGESGSAVLQETDGSVRVTLTVNGQPAGVAQPAHIHHGTCAELGGVLHPLEFPSDGGSVTTLATTFAELLAEGPLAVNVHKSPQEAQVYVACGDIAF
ncbi:MAG TPA: CHRD domain-containing protein [Candidatus Paceibacterota bacterium]|nr:CHRD domain-containing protein [Candidatus Paceibacterota bacterium]